MTTELILGEIGSVAGVGALTVGYILERKHNQKIRKGLEGEERVVIPRSNYAFNPEISVAWLKRLTQFQRPKKELYVKGQTTFTWIIEKDENGKVWFTLTVPKDREHELAKTMPQGVEWLAREKEEQSKPDVAFETMRIGTEHEILPIKKINATDVLPGILRAMPNQMKIEIKFSPIDGKKIIERIKHHHSKLNPSAVTNNSGWGQVGKEFASIGADFLKETGSNLMGVQSKSNASRSQTAASPKTLLPHERARLKSLEERYFDAQFMFEAEVQIIVPKDFFNPVAAFQGILAHLVDLGSENRFVPLRGHKKMYMSADELANLVHVPDPEQCKEMPVILEHARTLKSDELNEGVAIGYLQHPIQKERMVKIPIDQFTRHFVLSGMTGAGKSTTLVFMIQSLIDEWKAGTEQHPKPGFTFIDPATETILILLSRLQAALPQGDPLWKKVHFMSFANTEYPVGLNLLEILSSESLLEIMQRSYGGGSSIDEYIEKSVTTLKEDTAVKHVLGGMVSLLKKENWRLKVTSRVENELLRVFWESKASQLSKNPEMISPTEKRLRPFLTKSVVLYFGQPNYALPIRKWMDEGHIFLVDVKPLNEPLMKLLVGSMIERYHWVAQQRPESTALTHFLMVDECHRVQIPVMQNIIREDRKHGLSLGLITQSIEQFGPDLKHDIKDELGTVISLRQGLDGSKVTSDLSHQFYTPKYLQDLNDNVAAVYTRVGGLAESFETKAPPPNTYKGFFPNAEIVNFKDREQIAKRYDELRTFGFEMQKEIGKKKEEAEAAFDYYLKKCAWPKKEELLESKNLSKKKLTAKDI